MLERRLRLLQEMPILGGIREDTLDVLLGTVNELTVPAGEYLFRENDPGDAMYVLEAGHVAILKRWQGIDYRLNELQVGDCIGEMSFIDLGRRSASVLAMSDLTLIELTHASILDLYERDLEQFAIIQMNIGRELSRRLRLADEARVHELLEAEHFPQH